MLEKIFLQILNMSFTAGFVILFVLVARLLLKKSPKILSYTLWSVVLFRLICPFSFKSVFSLLPAKTNPISQDIVYAAIPTIDTGIPAINHAVNQLLPAATPAASVNPLQIWVFIGTTVWLLGIVVLLIYSMISLIKLQKRLKNAVHEKENIYLAEHLETPFVMGIIRPKIYLPVSLIEEEKRYILLHEQMHIRRLDHVVKIVSFFVLCLHWFNPFVWIAFFVSGKDMEMSCDEAVIKQLGSAVKKEYSSSLLALATGRRIIGGIPLAFGEGDTKGRIKNILYYKKPAFWVVVVSVAAVLCVATGLVTNPKDKEMDTHSAMNLWEARTKYVGDNSAVGKLIGLLPTPEGLQYDHFELHTAEPPYDLDIHFKTDSETRNFYTGALNQMPFKKNMILLFALIENVDRVIFTLDDGENPYAEEYTRAGANHTMGKDVRDYAASPERLQELMDYINQLSDPVGQTIYQAALTGYMAIDNNILYLDEVEIIRAKDKERMEELELNQQADMPNGYYIYNADTEKQAYELTKEAVYSFVDMNLLFVKEEDGDRVYTTTEKEEFLLHLSASYSDSPPAQKVPFFIEVREGKVISVTEKFEFTI